MKKKSLPYVLSNYHYFSIWVFFSKKQRLAAAKINLMKSLTELPVVCVYISVGGRLSEPGWVVRKRRDGETGGNSVAIYVTFDLNGRR